MPLPSFQPPQNPRPSLRESLQQHVLQLWEEEPGQFDSRKTALQRSHLEAIWQSILQLGELKDLRVADLGCGWGILSKRLVDAGAKVTAVDLSPMALEKTRSLCGDRVNTICSVLPRSLLDDSSFDLVLCCDVLAHLPLRDHRLLMSELARLVSKEGWILLSTPLDIRSQDSLQSLDALAQTELDICGYHLSYHSHFIKIQRLLSLPLRMKELASSSKKQREIIGKSRWIRKWWWLFWAHRGTLPLWKGLAWMIHPLATLWKNSDSLLKRFEAFSKHVCDETEASHIILTTKIKPLLY